VANVSNWKNFEREVAQALGGKRRLRTMESFSVEAPDVYFPKAVRREYPVLKRIAVECKKRRNLNINTMFVEAKLKYGRGERQIVLATKRPVNEVGREEFEALKKRLAKRYDLKTKKEMKGIKASNFTAPLVTVELSFFKELWDVWKEANRVR